MHFYKLPGEIKELQTERIMNQSLATFNHAVTAGRYIKLYEKMLLRPLINED